jgi:hypothetical protein
MPRDERRSVYWNYELVSYIENLSVDNYHLYGKWISAKSPEGSGFMAMLLEDVENIDVWVGIDQNKPEFHLASLPERDIDVRMLSNPPEKW